MDLDWLSENDMGILLNSIEFFIFRRLPESLHFILIFQRLNWKRAVTFYSEDRQYILHFISSSSHSFQFVSALNHNQISKKLLAYLGDK